jgi:hypothetical protein
MYTSHRNDHPPLNRTISSYGLRGGNMTGTKKGKTPHPAACPARCHAIELFPRDDAIYGAHGYTVVTASAQVRIDDKDLVTFTDGPFRALRFAGTASNAFIGNYVDVVRHILRLLYFSSLMAGISHFKYSRDLHRCQQDLSRQSTAPLLRDNSLVTLRLELSPEGFGILPFREGPHLHPVWRPGAQINRQVLFLLQLLT